MQLLNKNTYHHPVPHAFLILFLYAGPLRFQFQLQDSRKWCQIHYQDTNK